MSEAGYSREELTSMYELGRLYYEMGYVAPAERMFAGLAGIDGNATASRIGLGLLKLERGAFQEATAHFRSALQAGTYVVSAKIGLVLAFIGLQEFARARSLLSEVGKDPLEITPEIKQLVDALTERCA